MIFNGSDKIKDDEGDYLVLADYGCEGFSVAHQAGTHEDALRWMMRCDYGCPQTLVKLVRVDTLDVDLLGATAEQQGSEHPADGQTEGRHNATEHGNKPAEVWSCPWCGHNETWFDNTISCLPDGTGTGMKTRCIKCGRAIDDLPLPKVYELIVVNGDQILCERCYRELFNDLDPATHLCTTTKHGECSSCGASVTSSIKIKNNEIEHITEKQAIKENAIRLADDHRKHCDGSCCNILLYLLKRVLTLAGITLKYKQATKQYAS